MENVQVTKSRKAKSPAWQELAVTAGTAMVQGALFGLGSSLAARAVGGLTRSTQLELAAKQDVVPLRGGSKVSSA